MLYLACKLGSLNSTYVFFTCSINFSPCTSEATDGDLGLDDDDTLPGDDVGQQQHSQKYWCRSQSQITYGTGARG